MTGVPLTPDQIEKICLTLPGTTKVVQWMGAHVYKIGGKLFAIYADRRDQITLKCADEETAALLIEIGAARPAPHLPRGGWIALPLATTDPDELTERLHISYNVIRMALPKSQQAKLPPASP